MGAPRRNRRKYEKPQAMWNVVRIKADNELISAYGLKNMKELWKVQTELSRLRSNVRQMLSGTSKTGIVQEAMMSRLKRLGVVSGDVMPETLLELKENVLLERRLQSIVFRKGLARSMKQARQLITHGFIAVNGVKINRPGYMVKVEEEHKIGYYKPIDIEQPKAPEVAKVAEGALKQEA